MMNPGLLVATADAVSKSNARQRKAAAVASLCLGALLLSGCGSQVSSTSSSSTTTATTTTLAASSSSVASGASVTLTATVSPSAATGAVTFYDGTTSLGSATLSSGAASLTTYLSVTGTHAIEAIYQGDSTYAASTSSAISIAVAAGSTSAASIALIASPTATTLGSGVGLAAIVLPVTSTGTVTFTDNTTSTALGSATLSNGVAALTTTGLVLGSHAIVAAYSSLTSSAKSVAITAATAGAFKSSYACGYAADSATGAYVLTTGTLIPSSGGSYTTATTDQNVLCITGAASYLTLLSPAILSTAVENSSLDGDVSWYGLNAAVLDYNGGNLTIDGGTVTSSGAGGNLVYSYGTGTVTISNSTLSSTGSNNGHGVYAAGAGTVVANNVIASSTGAASSIVATDNGGGTVTINGGSYTASGNKSAGVYSTGLITANNATISSVSGEAVVIEGDNSVVLNNSTLASSSTGTHRGVFLYQSMSGDAANSSCGTTTTGDCLTMNGGSFTYADTTSGDSDPANNCTAFEVYNQTAHVWLTDVTLTNNCATLLLAGYNDQWSNSNAWGYANFTAYGTTLTGNVIVGDTCLTTACATRDTSSTAALYLYEDSSAVGSKLTGAINAANTGKTVTLTLDAASKWVVTGTSYLTALTDADTTYGNIACQTSGCKVYVNGTAIAIQ